MNDRLERDVRFLKRYAVASTLALVLISVAAFTRQSQHAKFDEIDVERINVVEKDGKLRLVISNRDRSPGPIGSFHQVDRRHSRPRDNAGPGPHPAHEERRPRTFRRVQPRWPAGADVRR